MKEHLMSISQIRGKEFNVQFSQNVSNVFELNEKCVMIGLRTSEKCYFVCQDSLSSSLSHV